MRVIKIVTVCCIISIISILIYKNINGKPFGGLRSTDLTKIKMDNISIDEDISNVDLSKYITDEKLDASTYNYNFDTLRLNVNSNGKINKIFINHSKHNLLNINGNSEFNNIYDIRNALGRYYKNLVFNKKQGLSCYRYIDKNSKIIARFVYDVNSNNLVYSIIEKMDSN